jgi:hypothetical protein
MRSGNTSALLAFERAASAVPDHAVVQARSRAQKPLVLASFALHEAREPLRCAVEPGGGSRSATIQRGGR